MVMPLDQDGIRVEGPVMRRCQDPVLIEKILHDDYFDAPIPYFSGALIRRARDLLASSPDVYFVTAEVRGEYAGFVFGHTLGQSMWRNFARAHLARHPFAIAWLVFRLKVLRPLQQKLGHWLRWKGPAAEDVAANVQALRVPRLDRPFAWSAGRPNTGQVDLLFVRDSFWGLGLAPQLLGHTAAEMARQGVTLIEAHVDPWNYASLRAFLKAGWEVYQTTGGDFYVCYHPLGESRGR